MAARPAPSGNIRKGDFQRVGKLLGRTADAIRQRRKKLVAEEATRNVWAPSPAQVVAMRAEAKTMKVAGGAPKGVRDAHRAIVTSHDAPDPTRPERPCARCTNKFQPTLRRRMLCARCFGSDTRGHIED